jgi:hypothetical protein
VGHVARMGEMKNANKIFVGKPEKKGAKLNEQVQI